MNCSTNSQRLSLKPRGYCEKLPDGYQQLMTGCHLMPGRWIVLVLCCLVSPVMAATSLDAFVTSSIENGVPVTSLSNEFNCADKIFSVIDIEGLSNGEHTLNADWIDPSGKRRKQTTYSFHRAGNIRITAVSYTHLTLPTNREV